MFIALLKNMRPKQWAKNALLLAGLVFDRQLTYLPALERALLGVLLFSLLSSSIYLINDVVDREADRKHPTKKHRPIASGALPASVAVAAAALFMLLALGLGFWLSPLFALICVLYVLLNFAYSFWLKHIPVIDVLVLASFYVLRVAAGVSVIDVQRFSPWIYVFTIFLALFLGIGKRRAELLQSREGGPTRKVLKGYTHTFLEQLLLVVLCLSIITYSLYTFLAPNVPENHAMMLTIPFVIYGFFRYLYLVQVKQVGEAPEEILFNDRPLQIDLLLWAATILLIFYIY
ncbi:MAG: decaprenyl-phosphate phosphoribosyltransferase [Anaerolineales bacterium]|nr:decaprenyl-phosphate phosphoribosyltransferase [Anaerolineales bacterium]MCW5855877.1 decaprenyl-phosphate phosphoribosyltransferase [Anaerolineales bacterium]